MAMAWYVVHTFSGYEMKAKEALEERIRSLKMDTFFEEILVPTEQVVELVRGKKRTTNRKFFPGYMLVKMDMNSESWHVVKNTPKVTGFIGGDKNPTPVPEEEILRISNQLTDGVAKPKPKVMFEKGESIRVMDGPFSNFNGVVEEVRPDKGKVRVLVSIFGRATPVELDFTQVEKT